MLNDIKHIKELWPGEALNIDDEEPGKDGTAYDQFIKDTAGKIRRRLVKLVGAEAMADAEKSEPADQARKDCIKDAELELFHVLFIEKIWRDKSAGAERDIQLPSGMRITLEAFSDYEKIIQTHVGNACRDVEDYTCY